MRPEEPSRSQIDQTKSMIVAETMPLSSAAKRLGIGIKAARKAAIAGELPAIKINGRWRVLTLPFEVLLRTSGSERDAP